MNVAAIVLTLPGCGGDEGSCAQCSCPAADAGQEGAAPDGSAGTSGNDASTSDSQPSDCVSATPCANDMQCATLPGYVCNQGLAPARCQLLGCAAENTICGSESPGVFGPGGSGGDSLCVEGQCRHPAPGPWVCRSAALNRDECLAVCRNWSVLAGCTEEPPCDHLCDLALRAEFCGGHGGLNDLHSSNSCGDGGTAICGDGEYFSF